MKFKTFEDAKETYNIIGCTLFITFLIVVTMSGCPQYNVYRARKQGEAALAHATYSKEVAVAEAKAKMESASYNAQADTIRAHGIARSNAIIGESLKDNDEYLHWLFIDQIKEAAVSGNLIYLPTEGGMPVMEAGRSVNRMTKQEKDSLIKKYQ